MGMTSAERQARYRARVKARAGETAEAMVERVRQSIMADWIADTRRDGSYRDAEDVEREVAFLGRVAARPLWHREGFTEWLENTLQAEVQHDVSAARKAEKRDASVRRRKGRAADRPRHQSP